MFPGMNLPGMNLSNDDLKQRAGMFANMSDGELQRYIDQTKAMNPMFANVTPAMLRGMSGQLGGMSEAEMDWGRRAAQSSFGGGAGAGAASPPSAQAGGNASAAAAEVPASAKADLEAAKEVKEQAAQDYREKNFDDATEKYFKVLSIIRMNESLRQCAPGKELETQARLNIALCKLNQKAYDMAID